MALDHPVSNQNLNNLRNCGDFFYFEDATVSVTKTLKVQKKKFRNYRNLRSSVKIEDIEIFDCSVLL